MIVRCDPEHYPASREGWCGQTFDDATRLVVCPHVRLEGGDDEGFGTKPGNWDGRHDRAAVGMGTTPALVLRDLVCFDADCELCRRGRSSPSLTAAPLRAARRRREIRGTPAWFLEAVAAGCLIGVGLRIALDALHADGP